VIAIETKYHENLKGAASTHNDRYDEIADASGLFRPESRAALRRPPLQQIWLDHLLAVAMQQTDGLYSARHVLVYPRLNVAVASAAEGYQATLEPGSATFEAITLEDLCDTIVGVAPGPEVSEFRARYLAFDTIPAR